MLGAASLVISLVALVVASFSVYIVSLRHANIVADVTAAGIRHVRLAGAVPGVAFLTGTLMVSNDGARGGLVDAMQVVTLEDDAALWGPLQAIATPWSAFPIVLQATASREGQPC